MTGLLTYWQAASKTVIASEATQLLLRNDGLLILLSSLPVHPTRNQKLKTKAVHQYHYVQKTPSHQTQQKETLYTFLYQILKTHYGLLLGL